MRISVPALFIVTLVLLSGCRTYGGYGSEEASFAQLQTAVARYEAQAERMAGDRQALSDASATDPTLAPFAVRMADLVDAQSKSIAKARATLAEVSDGSSYRVLHRALGSVVSQQQIVDDAYGRLLIDIQGDRMTSLQREAPARYQVVPVYYARIEASLEQVSLRDAISNR